MTYVLLRSARTRARWYLGPFTPEAAQAYAAAWRPRPLLYASPETLAAAAFPVTDFVAEVVEL